MRVNVYTEEMTSDVRVVKKDGFVGLRFYLESADSLHNDGDDDDRSAITFWGMNCVSELMALASVVCDVNNPTDYECGPFTDKLIRHELDRRLNIVKNRTAKQSREARSNGDPTSL